MNRQDLIDAILELSRDEHMQFYGWNWCLLYIRTEDLGRLFDAMADYDDVRHRAGDRRLARGPRVLETLDRDQVANEPAGRDENPQSAM